MFFNHNDGALLRIMEVRSTSSFSYLDSVVLGNYFLYFTTVMPGYSILVFYPMEVMHSFKFIRP